jgi:hypothetical protein
VLIGGYINGNNTGNRYEASIKAIHKDGQNVLGQLQPKLKEALGVSKFQEQALRDLIEGTNKTRYGQMGAKDGAATFIQESNPNLDQSAYPRIIAMIEASRNDFATKQREKIDLIRSYETAQGQMPGSFFLRLAGYPTVTYQNAHYDNIVMSTHAADAFQTGRDDGVNVNFN